MSAFPAVLNSEWTKIRTVASTTWTLVAALVVTVGVSSGLCALFNATFDDLPKQQQLTFDPTLASFAGMTLGQLAMIIFGVLVVGTEYSTGMIRTSLAAVPQRAQLLFGKLTVATALALAVGLATSFLSFFLGQAVLGERSIDIGEEGVLRAVIGAGLYMALIALFSMGVATMLRSSVLAICILVPFFLLISRILNGVSATRKVAQYLPDQAGSKIMQVVPGAMDRGETPYGPWGGLGIMVLWVAASVLGGYLVLKNRDA
ncbi:MULTISPECIES: ABC transporter permease subunit [unclassified Streptomyces]|uniref:ABC transporter permease subunit n=1 Tax=unclassified Streptomyces TaxID=2593676 RepID=UPI00224FA8A8|nr:MULTISPECIES: ABC transporter permease subunit [unclassified Streptomyces]MCX4528153.1 ABC transporter permease [Streptomyces sp. NBC_01551]MCX4541247.1 ABC transporter permease [Streptomyces sp. NBC_01565]